MLLIPHSEAGVNDSTAILNGPLMSFTFGNATLPTDIVFNEKGVQITFAHDWTAWGNEGYEIPRRLGENERPKAVRDSARCVYWDVAKQ